MIAEVSPDTCLPMHACQNSRARIRLARPDEPDQLTVLALRSKAYWGYDAAFMEACVQSLTVSAERIAAEEYSVLEVDGRIVGFAGLQTGGVEAELTNLFVEPWAIGRGYGKRLWQHVIQLARSRGATRMRIESDPFAEAFYTAMGAEHIGETPSDAIAGRTIPLLMYHLPTAGTE
jgi:GNAT superfamily N-acetyltransferase